MKIGYAKLNIFFTMEKSIPIFGIRFWNFFILTRTLTQLKKWVSTLLIRVPTQDVLPQMASPNPLPNFLFLKNICTYHKNLHPRICAKHTTQKQINTRNSTVITKDGSCAYIPAVTTPKARRPPWRGKTRTLDEHRAVTVRKKRMPQVDASSFTFEWSAEDPVTTYSTVVVTWWRVIWVVIDM